MRYLASFGGIVALAAAALLVSRPAAVSAHAGYDHSEPTAGSTLAAAPATVRVWFTETVQLSGSSLKVTNAAGQQVDRDDLKLDPGDDDHKILVISLSPNLPAGTYRVEWKTVSADDGDEDEGEFSFTVRPAAAPAAQPSPAAKPAGQPSQVPAPAQAPSALPRTGDAEPSSALPWLVLGGVLLVGGLIILRRVRASA